MDFPYIPVKIPDKFPDQCISVVPDDPPPDNALPVRNIHAPWLSVPVGCCCIHQTGNPQNTPPQPCTLCIWIQTSSISVESRTDVSLHRQTQPHTVPHPAAGYSEQTPYPPQNTAANIDHTVHHPLRNPAPRSEYIDTVPDGCRKIHSFCKVLPAAPL